MNTNTYLMNTSISRRFYTGLLSLLALISTCLTADAYTIYSYGGDEYNRKSSLYTADTYDFLYREKGIDFRSLRKQGTARDPFIINSFGRWGGHCLECRATPNSGSGVDRSEIEMAPAGARPGIPFGRYYYTGFSMNAPTGFTPPTGFFVAVQWWQVDPLSPPLAMNIKPTSSPTTVPFRFEGQSGNPDSSAGIRAFDSGIGGTLVENQWYDFIVKYRFHPTSASLGNVQVWHGASSSSAPPFLKGYSGPMGYYGTVGGKSIGQRVNQKFGLYRGAQNADNRLFFDEMTVGTNWSVVRPGQNKTIDPLAHFTFDNNITNNGYGVGGGGPSLVRGPSYSTDSVKGSRSLNFNASQQQYMHLASGGTSFYNEEGFNHTVSMWIKPDTVSGTQVLYDRSDTNFGFLLRLVGSKIYGSMKSYRPGSAGSVFQVNSIYATPVGAWTHVALTYEPQSLKMYINGSLRNSIAIPGYHSDFVISQGGAVLGGRVSGAIQGGGSSGHYYDGKIDDVFIYNKTLTQSEIYDLVHR